MNGCFFLEVKGKSDFMLLCIKSQIYLWSSFVTGSVNFGRSVTKLAALESVKSRLLENFQFPC